MHTRLAYVALALALVGGSAIVLAGGAAGTDGGPGTAAATVDTSNGSVISLSPASGANGDYAEVNGNGELALLFEDLNEDAETTVDDVFTVDVTATEAADVSIETDAPGVTFYWGGDPSADASDARTVQPGDSVAVGVRIDSYDDVDGGEFTVVAEIDEQEADDDENSSTSIVEADVSPTEITVGESVTATATIYNEGSTREPHTVRLSVDGTVVEQRTVGVDAGSTRTVSFERTFQQAGEFTVELGWRTAGTVTVTEPTSGGGFTISNASLSPAAIEPGESTTITADVTNDGAATDTFTAELVVGGVVVDERAVQVGPGATEQVTFERSFDQRGQYEIAISGSGAGTLRVESATATSVRRYGSEYGWLLGALTVPALGGAFVAARRRQREVAGDE
ncbi:hypothetical protein GCM10028857_24440 [Salinarchaeum chitinilyticum]